MNEIPEPTTNPYVGPRTFTEAQRHLFFGREREARDLLARVLSERLVLFYAQSGAGKSSLINARLIPQLREIGYAVLPVARVSGELPAGVEAVDNVYLFNLMLSLAQSEATPGRFAHLDLSAFLAGLSTDDGEHYAYDEAAAPSSMTADSGTAPTQPYVLIVDQFEELITSHPGRWQERAEFFRQLNRAMLDDPNLWVVLALREDYIAPIEPYAPLLDDRMRARFYMERMSVDAALDAIQCPADLGGRPFAAGVAEQLVEDLRQVRVPGQEATISGQYVEPVQLQVVCYQLWERLKVQGERSKVEDEAQSSSAAAPETNLQPSTFEPATRCITETDLREAGDVDQALIQFYEETLASSLSDPATMVTERQLRTWFDKELITAAGTRGLVRQGEETTGSLPNPVVGRLQQRFLVRAEARGGDTWIELVHDRFVEPIRASNAAWFPQHLSALQRQAALWDEQGHSSGLLLRDAALAEAEAWAAGHPKEVGSGEQQFLAACRQAQDAVERERRQNRRIRILAVVAGVVAILAIAAAIWAWRATQTANESATLANDRLKQMRVLIGADLKSDPDVKRSAVEFLIQLGEESAAARDFTSAEVYFQKALALKPDAGTPVYVHVPAGEFVMGAGAEDERIASEDGGDVSNEKPQHSVTLDSYWIMSTEVTNAQYGRCVDTGYCKPPADGNRIYSVGTAAEFPVSGITWDQAQAYAKWVGGRLPTEAEWEKACRGTDGRTYPWGNQDPTGDLLNFGGTGLGTWSAVGSYPKGASPCGALDMAGNVWEWTSSAYEQYPYDPKDGREGPNAETRVLRGGSFVDVPYFVRCAARFYRSPDFRGVRGVVNGFRVVVSPRF
jgi:formylglycine-generating enzyme required for sulfatase activity